MDRTMKLLKIPFDGAGKGTGARHAPDRIIAQLEGPFLNEAGRGIAYEAVDVPVDHADIQATSKAIVAAVSSLREPAIILGGDHAVTPACMRAFAASRPGAGIVIFDAHPDADSTFAPPGQDDLLPLLAKEGIVPTDRIILLGRRNWTEKELRFLQERRIRCYSMKDIHENGVEAVCDAVMETVRQWPAFYLSIDIDVVDPAYAPGTGYLEPGGLTSREIIYFCQRLKLLKNFGMADIVEVSPPLDVRDMTSRLAAKLVKELS
jgi:formiminoglutamase